ncbi:Retinal guanylyl cyclase 1 [Sparganum proliferum]
MKITPWHNPLACIQISSTILLFLAFPDYKPEAHLLQLLNFDDPNNCLQEFRAFNLRKTMKFAIFYAIQGTDEEMTENDVEWFVQAVEGCSLREDVRKQAILKALIEAEKLALLPSGFTVLIGPALPVDCNFVSDWVRQGDVAHLVGLYQIQYNCRLNGLVQPSVQVNLSDPKKQSAGDLVALSMVIQISTLVASLNVLLRHYGWQRIAIFYEISLENLQNRLVAERFQVFFSSLSVATETLNIVGFRSLRWGSQPSWYLQNFTKPVDAVLLLARPPMAAFFLSAVSNMTPIREGRIAIIQLDPSSAITYDVLRFWRLVLSNSSVLGAAGQSLFIMSALPPGTGYDVSSGILDSKIMVSAASAVAMAIRLTYLNLKANYGVLPEDTDFFQPLMDEPVDVPVMPNITYKFSREGDTFYDYYDFYFFSLSQKICNGSANSSQTPYDEIFELTSVIVWPLTHLVNVQTKIWPNGSDGPKRNYCLLTGCHRYLLWTAPELLREVIVRIAGTQKGDVYSFGIILQEILCCSEPFPDCDLSAEEIVEKVRAGDPPFRPEVNIPEIPYFYKDLMRSCWTENPDFRPTFYEIFVQLEQYSSGKSVAQALIAGNTVAPEAFDEVTIYFSDIVGFTAISAWSTPLQIVDLLNALYSTFDSTIAKFDVYKLPAYNSESRAGVDPSPTLNMTTEISVRNGPDRVPDKPQRIKVS